MQEARPGRILRGIYELAGATRKGIVSKSRVIKDIPEISEGMIQDPETYAKVLAREEGIGSSVEAIAAIKTPLVNKLKLIIDCGIIARNGAFGPPKDQAQEVVTEADRHIRSLR